MTTTLLVVRTVSESNGREHWAKKAKRVRAQRFAAALTAQAILLQPLPVVVTLVRVAPRMLDDDNLRGALKACRDGIADAFKVDDRDPRIKWRYGQRRGTAKLYGVEVSVTAAIPIAAPTLPQDAPASEERPLTRPGPRKARLARIGGSDG